MLTQYNCHKQNVVCKTCSTTISLHSADADRHAHANVMQSSILHKQQAVVPHQKLHCYLLMLTTHAAVQLKSCTNGPDIPRLGPVAPHSAGIRMLGG